MTPEEEVAAKLHRERQRKYYWKNRERILAKQKEYADTHREQRKAYMREYQKDYRNGKLRRDPNRDSEE